MINRELLEKSIDKANEIFSRSENLMLAGANANIYKERMPYLQKLTGDIGHVSFHPYVKRNIVEEFKEVIGKHTKEFETDYAISPYGSEEEAKARVVLAAHLTLLDSINSDNLLNNTIPDEVKSKIYKVKGFESPKLSKLLVKLYGEQSDAVKWFTNKCPKKLEQGLNENYKIFVSVLPHHIAGMSYYAPYNWGGKRWLEGWNKTSCMDTIRNSKGSTIFELVPNLLDETLAIAYLVETNNDDIFQPRYLARLLIRVVQVTDNDYIMLGLRCYFISNEAKYVLIEGLANQFSNFVHVSNLRSSYGRKRTEFRMPVRACWSVEYKSVTCPNCDGEGSDAYECCDSCEGDGILEIGGSYLPYVDDEEFLGITSYHICFYIPDDYLKEKGLLEERESDTEKVGTLFDPMSLAC